MVLFFLLLSVKEHAILYPSCKQEKGPFHFTSMSMIPTTPPLPLATPPYSKEKSCLTNIVSSFEHFLRILEEKMRREPKLALVSYFLGVMHISTFIVLIFFIAVNFDLDRLR